MVKLVNPHTKECVNTPTGVSFTMLLFRKFVPLYRGEYRFFWKYLLISTILPYVFIILGVIMLYSLKGEDILQMDLLLKFLGLIAKSIYPIIQVFIYNKGYIQRKLNQGWLPATKEDKEILLSKNILTNDIYEGDDDTTPYKPNRIGFYLLIGLIPLCLVIGVVAATHSKDSPVISIIAGIIAEILL